MTSTFALPIVDGVRVFVHDDLNRITTDVLIEQGDGFEDEGETSDRAVSSAASVQHPVERKVEVRSPVTKSSSTLVPCLCRQSARVSAGPAQR
jgi:hypothetical protein